MWLPLAATLTMQTYAHDVPQAGGDYVDVPFEVVAGTQEIRIAHSDGSDSDILDWGLWSPEGFRGWGGGLTDDAIVGVAQSSRGYLPGAITPGTWHLFIGKAKLSAAGGHYTVTVTCSDTQTLPVQPTAAFSPIVAKTGRQWYRGDFHVHSEQSGDASATFAQIATLAAAQQLDFVNLSDHNTVSQHALLAAFNAANPGVLLLRGAEVTTYAGHGNAVGISQYVEHRIGFGGHTINEALASVAAQGGIFIVNHPKLDLGDLCLGCAWNHPDTDWSKVSGLELITGNYGVSIRTFVPQVLTMWDELTRQGHHLAAIGGSDDHTAGQSTGPTASKVGNPTTLVLADDLSEAAILDAVRAGRTMVQLRGPTDPALRVTLHSEQDATEHELGDTVHGLAPTFTVHVTGGNGTFAQLWVDGSNEVQQPVTGDDVTLTLAVQRGRAPPAQSYRVQLADGGGSPIVITSHFYMPADVAKDSGGCNAGGTTSLLPLLLLLRRRRREAVRTS